MPIRWKKEDLYERPWPRTSTRNHTAAKVRAAILKEGGDVENGGFWDMYSAELVRRHAEAAGGKYDTYPSGYQFPDGSELRAYDNSPMFKSRIRAISPIDYTR